jgi:hypothetical protein
MRNIGHLNAMKDDGIPYKLYTTTLEGELQAV